jgi:hypothetical protein
MRSKETFGDFYRRHEPLSRTELYHRARVAGVPDAALLSKVELIHALAEVEAGAAIAA